MQIGVLLPFFISGVGLYLLIKLRFFFLFHPIRTARELIVALRSRESRRSLALALAGTLGVGNIFGVATGIMIGGAGSLFWLFLSSVFSMAIKYAETCLASDARGEGGFIRVLRTPASLVYGALTVLLALFMGASLQSAALMDVARAGLGLHPVISGTILLILLAPCLIKGIGKIEKITEIIIPLTTIIYIIMCLGVICMNFRHLPSVILGIITNAFCPRSAFGGIIPVAVREGFSRGILSNEAGIGSSATAHLRGGERTSHVAGLFGICEVFFDTTLLCTLTGLTILTSVPDISTYGTPMSLVTAAFVSSLGQWSGYILTLLILSFAYATIICWYFYGRSLCTSWIFTLVFSVFLLIPTMSGVDFLVYSTDLIILFMAIIVLFRIIKGRDRISLLSHDILD